MPAVIVRTEQAKDKPVADRAGSAVASSCAESDQQVLSVTCDCGKHHFAVSPLSSGLASPEWDGTAQHSRRGRLGSMAPCCGRDQDIFSPCLGVSTTTAADVKHAHARTCSASSVPTDRTPAVGGPERRRCSSHACAPIGRRDAVIRTAEPVMDEIEDIGRDNVLLPREGRGSGRGPDCKSQSIPLDRIVVDAQGNLLMVDASVVCDACPACEDTCSLPDCRGCEEKRMAIRGDHSKLPKPKLAYTLCEIRRHRTLGSCWLVAKGQVYDATPYLAHHPAGALAIARKAGGPDCTEDLEFHSGRAHRLWKQYRIGAVKLCPAQSRRYARGGYRAQDDGQYSSAGMDTMPICMIM